MFQSFATTSDPTLGPARLAALRAEIAAAGLTGFLVPRADAHQGETVAPCDARLAWLTGFTGSAGFAAVLPAIAGVFVDGRYRLQVRQQVAADFTPVDWPETGLADWLAAQAGSGDVIGFDPWLHSVSEIRKLSEALDGKDISLRACENLVDRIWTDRPPRPARPVAVHPDALAGESAADKRRRLAADLAGRDLAAAVLTLPDSICWLLNIRGADIPHTPIVQAFATLAADGSVDLFTDAPCTPEVRAHLGPAVRLHPYGGLLDHVRATTGRVLIDTRSCPEAVRLALGARAVPGDDPCILPKACKNETEIAGMREAHLRDGAAMVEFLAWLDARPADAALTEIDLVTRLEGFRRATNALRDISFETIAGAGPNGAVIHYRVTEASNRTLAPGDLVVIDSGGQYPDGTTDVTRTVLVGPAAAGADERAAFTRVLQGMIAISRIRWPRGVAGAHLDALARAPLWLAGQDYDHGTGHGVGAYLGVHEGPQRLSRLSDTPLRPGMVLSNEPGYYRAGAFGIRTENLVVVRAAPPLAGGDAHREMLDFDTLTLVPIDRRLIDADALSPAERAWLDAYHAEVLAQIGPRVGPAARAWLAEATRPL